MRSTATKPRRRVSADKKIRGEGLKDLTVQEPRKLTSLCPSRCGGAFYRERYQDGGDIEMRWNCLHCGHDPNTKRAKYNSRHE